jgi:integrase
MSDYPESAIETMRRQLQLVQELPEEVVDELCNCETAPEVRAVESLDEEDAEALARSAGHGGLEPLFSVSDADAQALLEMSDEIHLLGQARYSTQRHEFLLRRGLRIAKAVGGLADALEDRDAAEDIVRWINTEYTDSAETNKDYRVTLRVFGGLVSDGPADERPPSIAWVPGGYPSNYDPAPKPEQMFRWEEHIAPMLEACNNSRDRAFIALAWDLGPRPGELYDLTRGRVSDHSFGMQITLHEGKQGTRSPVIVTAVPYLQQWLQDHPSNDPDAPLWTRRNDPRPISNQRLRDVMKEVAERADMTPPSTPTPLRMRKSSASYLANQGVPQAHLEQHHGWSTGSDKAARYVAVFGEANRREIARAHGREIDVEDEPADHAPVECPRCDQQTPPDQDFCLHCGQAIDRETLALVEEALDLLDERLIELEDPEDRRETLSARRTIEEKPHAMDTEQLHDFVTSLSESPEAD